MKLKSHKGEKCSVDGCDKICEYDILPECPTHAYDAIVAVQWELFREAFPEMNGLPKKPPIILMLNS